MPGIEALKYGLAGLAALFAVWTALKIKAQAGTPAGERRSSVGVSQFTKATACRADSGKAKCGPPSAGWIRLSARSSM
jgi:hypothetical protein